jgi:acetyltransferase-like isoleucine patch superfamily enzyme
VLPLFDRAFARVTGRELAGYEAWLRGLAAGLAEQGANLRVGRRVELVGAQNIRVGRDVSFHGNTYVNAAGARGSVRIGDRTHVDQFCVLYGQGGLGIGSGCAIASGVIVYTQSNQVGADPEAAIVDQPVRYAPVRIGDDVWIGARAVILPGVTVGDHAVIGAGAVVREDVPAWAMVAGVPAKVIRDRREPPR